MNVVAVDVIIIISGQSDSFELYLMKVWEEIDDNSRGLVFHGNEELIFPSCLAQNATTLVLL